MTTAENKSKKSILAGKRRDRMISLLFFPLSLFYLELVTRATTFGSEKSGSVKLAVFISAVLIAIGSFIDYPIVMRAIDAKKRGKKRRAEPIAITAISICIIVLGLILMIGKVGFFKYIFTAAVSAAIGIVSHRYKEKLFTPTGVLLFLAVTAFATALINCGMTLGQLVTVMLFCISFGCAATLILLFCQSKKILRILSPILLGITTVIFCIQRVVYSAFSSYFGLDAAGAANNLGDFSSQAFTAIISSLPTIVLLILPTVLLILLFPKCTAFPRRELSSKLRLACGAFLPFIIMSLVISASRGDGGLLYVYNHPDINQTSKTFGILTSTRLELETMIFGKKTVYLIPSEGVGEIENPFDKNEGEESGGGSGGQGEGDSPDVPKVYGDNITEIDFASLIQKETEAVANAKTSKEKELHQKLLSMHKYYSAVVPTKKNEYTGIFEGKNLIYMTLEGFSGKVISQELTPTLYKMANSGFVFNNFYCSMWGGSTATGEYANMTGLFYNKASCLKTSSSNYMPLSLGNMFNSAGYSSYAFHANSHDYYSRHLSHPNMGFEFIAKGNGIEELTDRDGNKLNVKAWPQSDADLADVTVDSYIGSDKPFLAYYMTISGHGYYTWGGNAMSRKHKERVESLNVSDSLKPYFACQLEVEDMLTGLIEYLEQEGKLEDTVFVLSTDHYPYMLEEAQLAELYGLDEEGILSNYDLYKNSLIIWSASMKEPVTVDVPCSSVDILPTVYNLFGIKYDSRLFPGTDVLSGSEPLVIMNCVSGPYWGFINKYGSYSTTDGFVASEGYNADADAIKKYVSSVRKLVTATKNYTFSVLENDYYSYLYGVK